MHCEITIKIIFLIYVFTINYLNEKGKTKTWKSIFMWHEMLKDFNSCLLTYVCGLCPQLSNLLWLQTNSQYICKAHNICLIETLKFVLLIFWWHMNANYEVLRLLTFSTFSLPNNNHMKLGYRCNQIVEVHKLVWTQIKKSVNFAIANCIINNFYFDKQLKCCGFCNRFSIKVYFKVCVD